MSDTVIAAIVGAVAGIITGSIGSLFAPWANWGVEKQKQKLAYRKELISKWRLMAQSVMVRHNADREPLIDQLQLHADWYSLKPHLDKTTLRFLGARMDGGGKHSLWIQKYMEKYRDIEELDSQSWGIKILNHLIDDIGKIEEKWGLV